jgi:hypothetical protein
MLKKFICALTAVMVLSLVAVAQDGGTTLTGYLVDKACSGKATSDEAAAKESKACILMESCLKSGIGIYADGKFTELDAKGVELAKAALEKSKKDKGAKFKVTGKIADGKLAVASVTEVE